MTLMPEVPGCQSQYRNKATGTVSRPSAIGYRKCQAISQEDAAKEDDGSISLCRQCFAY
ncbi:GD20988 [Drosophila simulans]|uniref:GD20988 n=1 Tax=Drosophila simulans TaxID=7240 RepID=B4R0S4_DROSI|nr:GD20988 [Drosophila simulans]